MDGKARSQSLFRPVTQSAVTRLGAPGDAGGTAHAAAPATTHAVASSTRRRGRRRERKRRRTRDPSGRGGTGTEAAEPRRPLGAGVSPVLVTASRVHTAGSDYRGERSGARLSVRARPPSSAAGATAILRNPS